MSLTSNLLDKYGTVRLTDKWILFPDGHIAVYKLVCDKFNLTRCERTAIHHNTFNKANDGVEELTILTPSEHRREHCRSHKSTKSYQANLGYFSTK